MQQAVHRVMRPVYDALFHTSSHGFRPKRSAHSAIAEAKSYVDDGYRIVVDIDLEKFFDTVNHDRLIGKLGNDIPDGRVVSLIHQMLRARIVMPDGVVVSNEEGTPQGGPLSPLLSNIVLHELDVELQRRGHKFVRYADDCNIYVKSERAGKRVMESITRFIERQLRLKVNREKSAVAKPEERHFLGFTLRVNELTQEVEVTLSKRTKERIAKKVVQLTPRNWGKSLKDCIKALNSYLQGWIGYFWPASEEGTLKYLDAHIRRRLRAIQVKHWKRKRFIVRALIRLGVNAKLAWTSIYTGKKSPWKLSHGPAVDRGLRNAYFADRGLKTLAGLWEEYRLARVLLL